MLQKENESTQRNGIIYSHMGHVFNGRWLNSLFLGWYIKTENLHYSLVYISFFVFQVSKSRQSPMWCFCTRY